MMSRYWILPALLALLVACDRLLEPDAEPTEPTELLVVAGEGQADTVGAALPPRWSSSSWTRTSTP